MRALKMMISGVVILGLIFVIGGCLIPRQWQVSRSIVINASPEKIYPFVSQFKKWKKWSPWHLSQDNSLRYTYEGPVSGVGAKQIWTSGKMGKGWMQLTEAASQTGVAYALFMDLGKVKSNLHGKICFSEQANKTTVRWTDSGASLSLFQRWMSLFIKPMLSKDLQNGLVQLKALVENG